MVLQRISSYDQQGRLVCHVHNVPAVLRTARTIGNPNRDFYTCPRRTHEGSDNCGFFHWVDQLPPPPETEADIFPPARYSATGTPTNRPKHAASHQSPFLPSPTSPTKRSSPFKLDEEAKQKRLQTIKDAISRPGAYGSGNTGAQAEPSMSAPALRNVSEVLRTPESPSPFSPEKDQVMSKSPSSRFLPKTYKLSDLGLDLDGNRPGSKYEVEDDELWRDFSPPSSAEKVARSLLRISDNTKGKRRAGQSESEDDEVQFWQDAPDAAISQGNLFRQASTSVIESSTVASPVMETLELSGDKIECVVTSTVNGLSGIPDYVHMLERKLVAMEKSNAFKAKRIKELEAENQKFKSHRRGWSDD